MKKPKITMTVIKEEAGFSASINLNNSFIGTQAEDMEELKVNTLDALNLAFEDEQITFKMEDIAFASH